jgi:hypothetical protein
MGLLMTAGMRDQLFHAVMVNHRLGGANAMSRTESGVR